MSKKLLALLLALMCMMSMVACGSSDEQAADESADTETSETAEAVEDGIYPLVINSEPYCVQAVECDERGYYVLTCDADGEYAVTIQNPEGEEYDWKIYLLDEEFGDATRYIAEANEPTLEGEGTIEMKAGQYIYVYTSANSFELGDKEISEDAMLSFDYA